MTALKTIAVVESAPRFTQIIEPAVDQAIGQTVQIDQADVLFNDLTHTTCIVDLMFEDKDALSLIEDIRLKGGKMPIIALMDSQSMNELGMDESGLRKMALDAGANALFLSPFNLAELVQTLQRVCTIPSTVTSANEPPLDSSEVA